MELFKKSWESGKLIYFALLKTDHQTPEAFSKEFLEVRIWFGGK